MQNKLSRFNKLRMIIELYEGGFSPLAFTLVTTFGRDTTKADPVIAKFICNQERKYWLDLEPMLSDLKKELYQTHPED